MAGSDSPTYRKPRAVMLLAVAAFSSTVFGFYAEPVYIRGIVVSLVLGAWGLVDLTRPRVASWLHTASGRATGLFWVVVGMGVSVASVLASSVISKLGWGLFLGGFVAVYGVFVAVVR